MTDSLEPRLRHLFDRAISLPDAARVAFLDEKCRSEPDLRRRLVEMLDAAEGRAVPVESEAEAPRQEDLRHEGPGSQIGPYKLVRQIGEGGFGVVFLAEQKEPVARQVALKIIKIGMDTRQVVARFEQERQALALMDHSNIARVLDAGATDTGRPYFVMDLVKGAPIVDYCDQKKLPINDRLELFAQVCHAVQHAHGKGIIHRDLKPSNVLIGEYEDIPQAKVIDFGIAKATGSKLTDKTLFTEEQQVIGTLQYMSPEQAEGSLDIDTRTDIYSLGVLLYELLTGSTPFDRKTIGDAMFGEVQRMIREIEPPRPSTRLSGSQEASAIAAQRRIEPRRLGLLLRGELDWIVMKAIGKERTRRYETASGFALDIRRYLNGEAVVAAPPSRAYRVRKFVRRNKVTVTTIGAVAASLLVGAIGFAWQANIAQNERDAAVVAQRKEAEQRRVADAQRVEAQRLQGVAEAQRERAEAISQFVTDALQSSDPNEGGSQGILVAQAMTKANQLLDDGAFRSKPDIEASLRTVIANILYRNAKIAEALPLARRGLLLYERSSDGDNQNLANTCNLVATIEQLLGNLDAAEPLFERSLAMLRRLHSEDHLEVSTALNNLAILRTEQGRAADAEPLLVEALAIKRRLLRGDHEDLAMGLNNLAHVRDKLGREAETTGLLEEALAMYERLFTSHPQLAMALANLANLRITQGREKEAEKMFERSLAMYRGLFQGDHPDVARALASLANIREVLRRNTEAEKLFREALAMGRRLFPKGSAQVATILGELAYLLEKAERFAEAEPLRREALEMTRTSYPGDHPEVAGALDDLANTLRRLSRPDEARPLLVESLAMLERFFDGDNACIAKAMGELARISRDLGQLTEVEPLCRRALAMTKRLHDGDHPAVVSSMAYLSLAVQALERFDDAEKLWLDVAAMYRRVYGGDHSNVAHSLLKVAACRDALENTEGSREAFSEALAILRRVRPDGAVELARALAASAKSRRARGDHRDALPELEEAVAMLEKLVPADNKRLVRYREALAECRAQAGK